MLVKRFNVLEIALVMLKLMYICTAQYELVCGANGEIYGNSCKAGCAGQAVQCTGECPCPTQIGDCICTEQFDPVCGGNGMTYGNSCEARCAGQAVQCAGRCPCLKQRPS